MIFVPYFETMIAYMEMFSLDSFERFDMLTEIEEEILGCEIR